MCIDLTYAGKLLECLKQTPSEQSFGHCSFQEVRVATLPHCRLKLMVGTYFRKFFYQARVILGKPTKLRKRFDGFFVVALLDIIARGLRQEKHTSNQNNSPSELQGDWDSITARVRSLASAIIDDCG